MATNNPNAAWPSNAAPQSGGPSSGQAASAPSSGKKPRKRAGSRRRRNGGLTQAQIQALASLSKDFAQQFVMLPAYWTAFSFTTQLKWTTIKFTATGGANLPTRAGVYAFHVKPETAGDLNVSYLMYVGETVSLRRRYGDYVRESTAPVEARPKLGRMFRQYPDHLYFSYVAVKATERKPLEDALLTAFWPPVNHKLPAAIRAAKAAWT